MEAASGGDAAVAFVGSLATPTVVAGLNDGKVGSRHDHLCRLPSFVQLAPIR